MRRSTAFATALALTALERGAFDLLLLDCQMPKMDGYTAARRLRKKEADSGAPRLPVVALKTSPPRILTAAELYPGRRHRS